MAYPTNAQIDDAVPVSGTPDRAKTNAVLKSIVAQAAYLPDEGTVPVRSVENAGFTGGRLKVATGTDPDDCVNLAQAEAMISGSLKLVAAAPSVPDSPGSVGNVFLADEAIYICVAPNTWRMATLTTWE